MPVYSYKAIDKRGKEKKGTIEAIDSFYATEQLKREGWIPIRIEEQKKIQGEIHISFGKKVQPRDFCVFCRQFLSITQAGISLKNALEMLAEQTENKKLKEALWFVLAEVERGNTLADAFRTQPLIFPKILVDMVEAGERSGSLERAFERMAIHFEKEAKLKATIRKAMIYPVLLLGASIIVIGVMLLFVIPQFIKMFQDIDMEMPAFTMGVMHVSEWIGTYWYVVVLGVWLIVYVVKRWYETEQGRAWLDAFKMRVPIFGTLTVKIVCAQFARTTGTLITTGISMIDCLEMVQNLVSNVQYAKALSFAKEELTKGIPLSEPLKQSGIFPPMVYHMINIGEETGNMEDMLEKLADYYEEEVELTTQTILATMEPLIIALMSFLIGALVLAIIAPIRSMYDGLDTL